MRTIEIRGFIVVSSAAVSVIMLTGDLFGAFLMAGACAAAELRDAATGAGK